MSRAFELPTTLQALAGTAKLSGTEIRLRQFDALHQRLPLTARLSPPWGLTSWPGAKLPPASQLAAAAGSWAGLGWLPGLARLPVLSQLIL